MAKQRTSSKTLRAGKEKAPRPNDAKDNRFRNAIDEVADASLLVDPEGRLVGANAAATNLLGFSHDDFMRMSLRDLLVASDFLTTGEALGHLIAGDSAPYAYKLRREQGAAVEMETSASKLSDGQLLVSFRELNDRERARLALKRSEHELRTFVESALDCVIGMDSSGRITEWNPAAERTFGYQREQVIGEPLADVIIPERLRALHRDGLARFLQSGEGPALGRRIEQIAQRSDGTEFPAELSITSMHREGEQPQFAGFLRDITDRRRAEAALKASEARFKALVRKSWDAVQLLDPAGRITFVSPAVKRVLGYEPEDMVGQNALAFLHPEDAATAPALLEALLKEPGGTGSGVQRIRDKQGNWRWVESTATNLLNDPDVGALVINYREVTERKQAEDALRKSEARFKALVRNSADAVQVLGPGGQIAYVSAAVERVLGYKPEELVGRIAMELVHPDDAARANEQLVELMQKPGAMVNDCVRVRAKNGQWRWMECNVTNLMLEPAVGGLVVNYRDVTERIAAEDALRSAEERYRKLVTYGSDGLIIGDAAGKAAFVSPSVQAITGYPPQKLVGTNVFDLIHPDDRPRIQELQLVVVQNPKRGIPSTFRVRHKSGRWVWVECICTNWINEPGINGLVANIREITERVELEQQLQQAVKMEAVGRLAGGVAHDFNNMLTAISGFTELMMPRLKNDPISTGYATQVLQAADRAATVTRQLLAFSRRQIMQPVVLDLNQRVEEIEKLIRRLIGEDIELRIVGAEKLHRITADPGQIDQVLMNLAVNARDAMPGGGRLTIETANVLLDQEYARVHRDALPGNYVVLAVTDTGTGMDAATQAKLFEPFFTTKEKGRGTGLGLATVYGIVKQTGGHIWVYSELGHGTTFKIYLPSTLANPDALSAITTEPAAGGGETVLVAEDEDGVRALICEALSSAGYSVLEAVDGAKALELVQRLTSPPHLLLTDVIMPRLGGKALAEALVSRYPEMRVIFMSGYTDDAIVRNGTLMSGVNFIQKPFNPSHLLRRVRQILDGE